MLVKILSIPFSAFRGSDRISLLTEVKMSKVTVWGEDNKTPASPQPAGCIQFDSDSDSSDMPTWKQWQKCNCAEYRLKAERPICFTIFSEYESYESVKRDAPAATQ